MALIIERNITTVVTTTYTPSLGETVRLDPSGGAFPLNLPTAVGHTRQIEIKNVTTSTVAVTLDGYLSETLDGSSTFIMNIGLQAIVIISDGANWMVF